MFDFTFQKKMWFIKRGRAVREGGCNKKRQVECIKIFIWEGAVNMEMETEEMGGSFF